MIDELLYTDLVPSQTYINGYSTSIFETPSDPSVLVKEVNSLRMSNVRIPDYDKKLFIEEVGGALEILSDPSNGLAYSIPDTSLQWGRSHPYLTQERGFIVMKKVEGQEIQKIHVLDSHLASRLDCLLSSVLLFGMNNLNERKRERTIPDIIASTGFINIVIGTTDEDDETKPYIIDTYPASVSLDYLRSTWLYAIRCLKGKSHDFEFPQTTEAMKMFFRSPQLRRRK